jgi:hypothetical protein
MLPLGRASACASAFPTGCWFVHAAHETARISATVRVGRVRSRLKLESVMRKAKFPTNLTERFKVDHPGLAACALPAPKARPPISVVD